MTTTHLFLFGFFEPTGFITTRDKRASAISVTMPFRGLWPLPDGSLNAGDRLQAAHYYRGIAAAAPESPTTRYNYSTLLGVR